MAQAQLVSGQQQGLRKYTAGGAVSAGDIIIIGKRPFVAVRDIANGAVGTLSGYGGQYLLLKDDSSGPVIADGEEVAWIDGSNLATDVITGNTHFGYCEEAAGASDGTVLTRHMPHGATTNVSS